jgi:hypothetical protein
MVWAIASLIVGLILLVGGFYLFGLSYSTEGWGLASMFAGGTVVLGAALMLILVPVSYHFDTIECQNFEKQTSYKTKMVRYYWTSWTCMAEIEDGRWLPKDQLRDIND